MCQSASASWEPTPGGWIEGDDTLLWYRIELRDAVDATMRCLWEFVALADAPAERFLTFFGRWGLLDFGDDADGSNIDHEAWSYLDDWREAASVVEGILLAMAATEEGQLVAEEVLLTLRDGDDYNPPFPMHPIGTGAPPYEAFAEARLQSQLARFRLDVAKAVGLRCSGRFSQIFFYLGSVLLMSYLAGMTEEERFTRLPMASGKS